VRLGPHRFYYGRSSFGKRIESFCDLYNKGLIYRGVRMVNWDPKALTALSDEEVIFKEQQGKLYYIKYKVASPSPSKGGDVNPAEHFGLLTAKYTKYDLLKKYSKELRHFSTEAEAVLWEMLRRKNLEAGFSRQHIIGDYIVDFVCLPNKLIIEVDSDYHNQEEIAEDRCNKNLIIK